LVKGQIEFGDGSAPVKLDNMFAGDGHFGDASGAIGVHSSGVCSTGRLRYPADQTVALDIESFDQKKQLQIDSVFASRREVPPGEPIELDGGLVGENGAVRTAQAV